MRVVKWRGAGLGLALRSEHGDGKVVLVPTHAAGRVVADALRAAGEDPRDYGIRVLAEWVSDQWRRVGDGTHLIASGERMPHVWEAFDARIAAGAASTLRRSKGTMALAETLGTRAVAWLPEEGSDADAALPLTTGERELLGVAREYVSRIRKAGLSEIGNVYKELPSLLAGDPKAPAGYVLAGFSQMGHAQQALVAGLDASCGGVSLVVRATECDLLDSERRLRDDGTWDVRTVIRPGSRGLHVASRTRHMMEGLEGMGATLEEIPGCHGEPSSVAAPPVAELAMALFMQDASDGVPCRSLVPPQDGSVSLLHVAGQTAEDAAVAEMARELAVDGDVAIVGPDAWSMWPGLVPRLVASRDDALGRPLPPVRVVSDADIPLSSVRPVSVFVDAARQMVRLAGLLSADEREMLGLPETASARPTWSGEGALRRHGEEETSAGWFLDMSRDVLGDMSWWPPDAILDLMSEELSGVPTRVVTKLRSQWSRNRRLSAYAVLSTLMDEEQVGHAMSGLAALVAEGQMGKALSTVASRLHYLASLDGGEEGVPVATQAMRAVAVAATGMLSSATRAIDDPDPGDRESVERYFSCVEQVLAHESTAGELRVEPAGLSEAEVEGLPTVRLLSLPDLDGVATGSYGSVIMTGQDSVASAVRRDDTPRNVLMRKLGCLAEPDGMSMYRAQFMSAVAAARSAVVFERSLLKVSGRRVAETFPSVGLSNVVLAYRDDMEGDILVRDASEVPFVENASPSGRFPTRTGMLLTNPVGECSDEAVDLMWASRMRGGEDGEQVVLTASDVDLYASCGYKWLVDRVLGASEPEARIPAYAFGSFAHAVVEDVHRGILQKAARSAIARAGQDGGRDPSPYVLAVASGSKFDAHPGGDGDDEEPGDGTLPQGYAGALPGARIGGPGQVDPHDAEQMVEARMRARYAEALSGRCNIEMIPHTMTDAAKADTMARSVEGFAAYETQMFFKNRPDGKRGYFVPRFVELPFGEEYGRPVTIAGVPFRGVIDRIDVNPEGECIIIDYKNESPQKFDTGRSIAYDSAENLQLAVYAMAVRQILPDLRIAGLAYVCTRSPYAVAGKLDDPVFDATDAKGVHLSERSRLTPTDSRELTEDYPVTMEALIDKLSETVEGCVRRMVDGEHEASECPACSFCTARGLCEQAKRTTDGSGKE